MNNYKYSDEDQLYMLEVDYTDVKTMTAKDIFLRKHEWCMYFWIPQEIHMKRGKMAGQVGHAAARLARQMNIGDWEEYVAHEVKIVYKVPSIESMLGVRDELLIEYPVEHYTLVFDNTWEKYTVFGIATKRDLKNKKWKLA